MSEVNAREFELRFKGLHRQPDVVARTVGKLNHPNEVIHVIEHSSYEAAQEKIKTLEARVEKLKRLMLLTDPIVSNVEMNSVAVTQWDEYIREFPDEANVALKEDEEQV